MKVFKTVIELKNSLKGYRSKKPSIGFVPTMGALHEGHLSLIEESKKHNDISIVSIFINPTQFDKKADLKNYPRTIEKDLLLLKKINCDLVFVPSVKEIYTNAIEAASFDFDGLEIPMEGSQRKGHFDGVGTIVKKLFEIVVPTHAYFGEKDFQQLQIIRKMVEKNHLPVKIIGCATYREENGLAMSSRNQHLTKEEKKQASIIYRVLSDVVEKSKHQSFDQIKKWVSDQFKNHPLFNLQYFTIVDEDTLKSASKISKNKLQRAFIAISTNKIRLIDNISMNA